MPESGYSGYYDLYGDLCHKSSRPLPSPPHMRPSGPQAKSISAKLNILDTGPSRFSSRPTSVKSYSGVDQFPLAGYELTTMARCFQSFTTGVGLLRLFICCYFEIGEHIKFALLQPINTPCMLIFLLVLLVKSLGEAS